MQKNLEKIAEALELAALAASQTSRAINVALAAVKCGMQETFDAVKDAHERAALDFGSANNGGYLIPKPMAETEASAEVVEKVKKVAEAAGCKLYVDPKLLSDAEAFEHAKARVRVLADKGFREEIKSIFAKNTLQRLSDVLVDPQKPEAGVSKIKELKNVLESLEYLIKINNI